MRDQVAHPYKIAGEIIVLCILIASLVSHYVPLKTSTSPFS
jgi:hypothetical protein